VVKRLRGGKLIVSPSIRRQQNPRDDVESAVAELARITRAQRIEMVPIGELRQNPLHARIHKKEKFSHLAASMRHFKNIAPLLVGRNNVIIAGYARWQAAKLNGLKEVPTIRAEHLSEQEQQAYALADNRFTELAEWDLDLLKLHFEQLSIPNLSFDLELTGFGTAKIDQVLGSTSAQHDDADDVLPPIEDRHAVSRPDDVWILDTHRLICGDALLPATYERLLGDTVVQMVFADVPYNCRIGGHARSRRSGHREFLMASGEMSPVQYRDFLTDALTNTRRVCANGAIVFVCMDHFHMAELLSAGIPLFGKPKNLCVWVKDNAGMGSFYRSQHELILAFKVGDGPHINNFGLGENGRYRTNVWQYPGANSAAANRAEMLAMHPTVKPCALVMDAIKDCSRRNGSILDPFAGSGTTLIACERTGRRGYAIELDPHYVDLIIHRWQNLTGQQATHAATNETFATVSEQREALRKQQ
jgi:DNA modification methylase